MKRPNIILIVLDAIRTDHVSWYGYERETTPTFDSLAADGVVYRNAFAPSVWTPTVHGSIFTGKYPSHSGVYTGGLGLPVGEPVLPELLSQADYQTFGTTSGAHIREDRGYARGFDEFVETYRIQPDVEFLRKLLTESSYRKQVAYSLTRGSDDKTLYKFERMRRFIDRTDDSPFFCFINCKTAHEPWNPPRPYKGMWGPELARPKLEITERLLRGIGREPLSVAGHDIARFRQLQDGEPVLAGEMELSEDEWSVIKAWYDGAIRYLDDRLGSFVEHLKSIGEFDDTLFVVTSDHGDHFGDHGGLTGHRLSVHDTLLHVPLVISPPSGGYDPGTEIDAQVTLADLYDTFLETADMASSDYPLTTSLTDWSEQKYHDYTFAEYAYPSRMLNQISSNHPSFEPEGSGFDRSLRSVRDNQLKLIIGSDGERSLYRWREDRYEENDLATEYPEEVERLESVVMEKLGTLEKRAEAEEQVSGRVRDQLERLGYRT